jgi:serine/threonine protein kinase
LKLG